MRSNLLISILLLCTIFFACDNNEVSVTPFDLTYFPLQIGNHWEYEPVSLNNPQVLSVIVDIPSTHLIEGREYFLMVSKSNYPLATLTDSAYYRMDTNGFVYEIRSGFPKETNVYRLAASHNESWKVEDRNIDDLLVTATFIEPVILNNTEIENCKSFYFDSPRVVDEERYVILAPRVGIVQKGGAWGFDVKLKKATIDGREYNF